MTVYAGEFLSASEEMRTAGRSRISRSMDLAGLHSLLHQPVIVAVSIGTKFIGRLQTVPGSSSTVALEPLDARTAAENDYAINGVSALDIGSIVFIQRLAG